MSPPGIASSGHRVEEMKEASADMLSVIRRGIPTIDEICYLVSSDGQKFPIHEKVFKESSEVFKAALEICMQESGK
jgi:hypothetical protein